MATFRVLKVPQSDNDKEFVLLQVSSSGKKPLDLKLIGTEGEAPYVVKTTVQTEASISITVRKQVQGITQRLGTITLSHDANEAIELLEWCAASADAVVASNQATAHAQSQAAEREASIQQLKTQLDELVRAKDEDETALLQKFRDLLNEKKVKIREQQKVLASPAFSVTRGEPEPAEPSPEPEQEVAPRARAARGRKPAASRASKRKAAAPVKEEEVLPEEEPRIKSEPEDTEDGHTTEATASVDDDEDEDEHMAGDDGHEEAVPAPPPAREQSPPKKVAAPPPKRALPFANRKPNEAPRPAVPTGGADTDSDDELYMIRLHARFYLDAVSASTSALPTSSRAKQALSQAGLASIILGKLIPPKGPVVLLPAQRRHVLDLLGGELELGHELQHAAHPLGAARRRERHDALVETPAQADLGLADAVLLRQRRPRRVHGPAAGTDQRRQRAVRRDRDAVPPVKREQVHAVVLQVRVELNLVDGRHHLGRLEDRLQVLRQEVGHANRPGPARGLDRLHLGPFLLQRRAGALGEPRPVQQIEIDIVDAELLEGRVKVRLRVRLFQRRQLGRNVELLARHAALFDGRA
ncbi:DNA double-strand break repair and VJ recombination XRCC4 [Cordyceps militaris CM01]|uniref:DNA double-strand break repair and VJ recombination XRCC4 n=1 Tax=Cordyceps militaris (strain CM01) TaxID=983644 RepID=G3JFW1_CORMM|nr:DNA double-strand break repair and VJ recombination XRCC4 [Cordyceps militaris CM01]EGX93195.1 DNA double-strand break repair and VJ recombination XRCC4 [Cordyceps militaris CM01]